MTLKDQWKSAWHTVYLSALLEKLSWTLNEGRELGSHEGKA